MQELLIIYNTIQGRKLYEEIRYFNTNALWFQGIFSVLMGQNFDQDKNDELFYPCQTFWRGMYFSILWLATSNLLIPSRMLFGRGPRGPSTTILTLLWYIKLRFSQKATKIWRSSKKISHPYFLMPAPPPLQTSKNMGNIFQFSCLLRKLQLWKYVEMPE